MAVVRLRLRGEPDALARALDWCLVRGDVLGVVERDAEVEIALARAGDVVDRMPGGVQVEHLADDGSKLTGLEHDAPIFVGESIVVRPPWVGQPTGFCGTTLIVPRGGAFGSGEHGSTQAALLALEASWPDPAPAVFLDVGTGSGILALYAAQRGAGRVFACDVDPAAVRTAAELLPTARVELGGVELWSAGSADAVVANLNATEQAAALDGLLRCWSRRGPLVLSGLRVAEVDAIAARIDVEPECRREVGGFVALAYPSGV